MRFVGMEWAPLQLPLHRRLETLAAVYFTFSFLAQGIVGWLLLLYVLLCTRLYPLSLLYAAWLYWDRNTCDRGGRRSDWARRWTIWKYFRDYFPIRLVKTCELPADRNYLLGCHPHGIMCAGAFCNFATEGTDFSGTFPGIWPHLLVLRGQFALPLHRELMLMGGMCSATQESLDWILSREPCGNAAVLVVGGAIEALEARPGRHRLFLSRRKGFVRTALRHGTPLVPVFSFGENELFAQLDNADGSRLRRLQTWLTRKFGFSPPLFIGRGIFQYSWGLLPHRRPVVTVVGRPLDVPRSVNPSAEEVDRVHRQYVDALVQLFNEHKSRYEAPGAELIIT
ncbi:2-acylglycerol O-acyltransferase 2-like isoform X2 [Amblyomma americanum]